MTTSTGSAVPATLYSTNPFIQLSQRADLAYMQDLLDRSGSTDGGTITLKWWPAEDTKISAEILASTPTITEDVNLCKNTPNTRFFANINECLFAYADMTSNTGALEPYDSTQDLIPNTGNIYTTATWKHRKVWYKDKNDHWKNKQKDEIISDDDGIKIDNTNEYIGYTNTSLYSSLVGKTVMIELKDEVGKTPASATQTKFYIADFGTVQFYGIKNGKCVSTDTSGNYLCKKQGATQYNLWAFPTSKTISLLIPVAPTQMIIGNFQGITVPYYNNPIWTTITSIKIR